MIFRRFYRKPWFIQLKFLAEFGWWKAELKQYSTNVLRDLNGFLLKFWTDLLRIHVLKVLMLIFWITVSTRSKKKTLWGPWRNLQNRFTDNSSSHSQNFFVGFWINKWRSILDILRQILVWFITRLLANLWWIPVKMLIFFKGFLDMSKRSKTLSKGSSSKLSVWIIQKFDWKICSASPSDLKKKVYVCLSKTP